MKSNQPKPPHKSNRSRISKITTKKMIRLNRQGCVLREIGDIAGTSHQAVQVRLKKKGEPRRINTIRKPGKNREKNFNPKIEKEQIEQLYINQWLPIDKIARQYKIGSRTVRSYLLHYGIPVRSKRQQHSGGRIILTKELLTRLYLQENFTAQQIADQMNYSKGTVSELASRYKLLKTKKSTKA